MQFLGFGSGKDGAAPASGTYTSENQSCSGNAGSTTLTCGGTFVLGDQILIQQSRGTGAYEFEVNYVISDNGANLTLLYPLVNTYTDSGASQAQVVKLNEYNGGDISGTLISSAWNSNIGGIMAFLCDGELTISGNANVNSKGFVGGAGIAGTNFVGRQGEGGSGAAGSQSVSANGNGAGGGGYSTNSPWDQGNGAGGGGNGVAGSQGSGTGGGNNSNGAGGAGGEVSGSADLTTVAFGGAGGSGGGGNKAEQSAGSSGGGGIGGGFIYIAARKIIVSGSLGANGGQGIGNVSYGYGAGGSGGGGSIFIKSIEAEIGSNKISAVGGTTVYRNGASSGDGDGGAGGNGRIRIETCSLTGATTQGSVSVSEGGQDYCSILGHIF